MGLVEPPPEPKGVFRHHAPLPGRFNDRPDILFAKEKISFSWNHAVLPLMCNPANPEAPGPPGGGCASRAGRERRLDLPVKVPPREMTYGGANQGYMLKTPSGGRRRGLNVCVVWLIQSPPALLSSRPRRRRLTETNRMRNPVSLLHPRKVKFFSELPRGCGLSGATALDAIRKLRDGVERPDEPSEKARLVDERE